MAVAAGAADFMSNLAAAYMNYEAAMSANATNIKLQKEVNEWNRAQVLEERQYNTPVNQMKRLTEAGLNPNLLYGSLSGPSGNVASGSAASVQPADMSPLAGSMDTLVNTMLQQRQMDIEQQRVNQEGKQVDSVVKYNDAASINFGYKNKLSEANAALAQQKVSNLGKQVELMQTEMDRNQAMISNLDEDTRLKEVERLIAEVKKTYTADEMQARINNMSADTKRLLSEYRLNAQQLSEWVQTFALRRAGLSMDNFIKRNAITESFQRTNKIMAEITGINLENERLSIAVDADKLNLGKMRDVRGETGDALWDYTAGSLLCTIDELFSVLPFKFGAVSSRSL